MIIGRDGPAKLAEQLRCRDGGGDVHLVGGPRTIRAFQELGALDRLETLVLPVLLEAGIPLCPPGTPKAPLGLLRANRSFPDGTVELVYAPR